MSSPSRWVRRATLSALAGGGLTAASLGGPLTGGALAAPPVGATGVPEGTPAPVSAPEAIVPSAGPSKHQAPKPTTTTSTPSPAPSVPSTPQAKAPSSAPEAPAVVVQRRQKVTTAKNSSNNNNVSATQAKPRAGAKGTAAAPGKPTGPNGVALPPALVAAQASALAAEFAGSAASAQALAFYRIPLFLLPIYQAAAVQYGVPWQILAAINEIETNSGLDQSVSTAGAVGWMQFMPATWMQYGVDALNAGYADPYNPVDAIFAAARYLRAAGAQSDLHGAILAYNHSEEYVSSVLLRAKLISTYPKSVIATLTGLIDDGLPVTGKQLAWGPLLASIPVSSATANATAVPGGAGSSGAAAKPQGSATPGTTVPPSPAVAAMLAQAREATSPQPAQFVDLMSVRNAAVVAVQDGRIVALGNSHSLGRYVILRDVYGDVFTYAGLGSIAPTYRLTKKTHAAPAAVKSASPGPATNPEPAPSQPASAGRQPLTLTVKKPARQTFPTQLAVPAAPAESVPAGMGKVRLFAHPGNPDALAARASARAAGAADGPQPLRSGSVVAKGTVLGHVRTPLGASSGHLRFAIRPARDLNTIDPRPILQNWMQLNDALHPLGAKGEPQLLGATSSDVFLFTKAQLQRAVLSDPGIVLSACSRHEVASGAIDKRVLAVLAFLSRSGLQPSVSALRCGAGSYDVSGYVPADHLGDGVAISQVNGLPISGNQGAGSITDTTIRTLLTLQGEFIPKQIISLMKYPGAPSTLARPDHGGYIEIVFAPAAKRTPGAVTSTAAAHSAGAGRTARPPLVVTQQLSAPQWNQLMARVAALPVPVITLKPSSSAIPDPKSP
jgi:hypothetical protein